MPSTFRAPLAASLAVAAAAVLAPRPAHAADARPALDRIARAEARLSRCVNECGKMKATGARMMARVARQAAQVESLLSAGRPAEAKARYDRLAPRLPSLRSKLDRAHARISACRSIVDKARAEFERARTRHPEAERQLAERFARIERSGVDLAGQDCEGDLVRWRDEIARVEAIASRLGD